MDLFPKKYNNKNLIKNQKIEKSWVELYSPNIPLDQKINPWSLFSMYYKDMYCKLSALNNQALQNITWYTVSSLYFSSLDNAKSKLTKIQLPKSIQKNISFIKNLWLNIDDSEKNFVMTEKFNRYMREVFYKLYSNKKLAKEQIFSFRSKNNHTDISDTNIIEKKVPAKKFNLKYFIGTKWQAINIITNRLETIFWDVALLVNPTDKRYKKLIWENVLIPIINKNIPIIWDDTISSFYGDWTWIMRVTPWHDEISLSYAKKHWLPTEVFAIDSDWKFTENTGIFSWKDLSEFYDNIVKYVDDIWNMYSQTEMEDIKYFDKNTWEELYPMTLQHWTLIFDYAKDYLINYVQNHNFENIDIDTTDLISKIESKNKISISKKSSTWYLIPIVSNESWENFVLDEENIINTYWKWRIKKDIVMTLIIQNLILNNDLPSEFTLQELIDVLFSKNFMCNNTKIWEYINIFTKKSENESLYKNWLKVIKKFVEWVEKDIEKVESLNEILENSFAIQIDWEKISINYHDIFWVAWLSLQTTDSFNKNFIDYCRVLYNLWCEYSDKSYKDIQNEERFYMVSNQELDSFVDINLLALEYSKRQVFSDVVWHPELVDEKWQTISNFNSKFLSKDFYENFNQYWIDSMRLDMLFSDKKDEDIDTSLVFNTYSANKYYTLLTKIWNANRYLFGKYKDRYGNSPIKIKEIIAAIDWSSISDYDNWILHNMKIIIDDVNYQISEKNYLKLWKKIFDIYLSEFCDKYINITKVLKKEKTEDIMLLIGLIFLKLLYPYMPNFVSDIENRFNVDRGWISVLSLNNINLKEKNYKINIFIDIIDKIACMKSKLWLQRHEIVDIFVQANPDLLQFLQENEHILRLLTKIQTVTLLRVGDELLPWYETDNVINISVWVKKPEKITVEVRWDMLAHLENEYKEKQDHLQHLKSLFASIYTNAWQDLVEKKRQEISTLQNELEDLEFKIWKLKIKN